MIRGLLKSGSSEQELARIITVQSLSYPVLLDVLGKQRDVIKDAVQTFEDWKGFLQLIVLKKCIINSSTDYLLLTLGSIFTIIITIIIIISTVMVRIN